MTEKHNASIATSNRDLPALVFVPSSSGDELDRELPMAEDAAEDTATHVVAGDIQGLSPALIVVHDHYGLDDHTSLSAQRLAEAGCMVVVPDLFHPETPDVSSESAMQAFTLGLPDSKLVSDLSAAVSWLQTQDKVDAERIGVVGWGWGGAYALMLAGHDSRVKLAVDVGGHLTYPVLTAEKPGSPLNFVGSIEGAFLAAFAAEDAQLPAIEIERLKQQIAEHERRGEVKTYSGTKSRFWRDADLPQTRLLWRRIEGLLESEFGEQRAAQESELVEAS